MKVLAYSVERMLYLALVMIFIGVGIAAIVLYGQINQIKKLNSVRVEAIDRLQTAVGDLKKDNSLQTQYLECIIKQVPPCQNSRTTNVEGPTARVNTQPVSKPTTSPPSPQPKPNPPAPAKKQPAKSLLDGINNFIKKILENP